MRIERGFEIERRRRKGGFMGMSDADYDNWLTILYIKRVKRRGNFGSYPAHSLSFPGSF